MLEPEHLHIPGGHRRLPCHEGHHQAEAHHATPYDVCFRIGADAPTVQALAGHRHLSVTQRYAHTNEEAKRKMIESLSLAS